MAQADKAGIEGHRMARTTTFLFSFGVFALGLAGLLAYGPRKTAFVVQCAANGRALADCGCMYEARAEYAGRRDLPPVYAELARMWAHAPEHEYRSHVYSTVFWQSVRSVPVVRSVVTLGDKPTPEGTGVFGEISRRIGEQILAEISGRLGVEIVPWVAKARMAKDAVEPVWDLVKARAVMSRHCGDGRTAAIVRNIESVNAQIAETVSVYTSAIGNIAISSATALGLDAVTAAARAAGAGVGAALEDLKTRGADVVGKSMKALGDMVGGTPRP